MHSRSPAEGPVAARYAALVDLGHVLTGILRAADLYEAVGGRLTRALPLEGFFLSRLDEGGRATVVHRSDAPTAAGESTYGAADCMAIRDRRPVLHLPGDPAAAIRALGLDSRGRPALSAPVLCRGRVCGVLTALGPVGTVYDNADLEFLAAVADLLGPILNGHDPASESAGIEIAALGETARAVANLSLDDALRHAVLTAHEMAAADGSALWLVRTGGELEVVHSQGPLSPRKGETVPLTHELFRNLAGAREPLHFDNRRSAGSPAEFQKLTKGTTGLVVPLHAEDRIFGALVICFTDARSVPAATEASILRFAALASIGAGYARLHEQIASLSLIDPITGIPNRRQLAIYLEKEFAAARRGRRLTLLLFDIDDFAAHNKLHGRQASDAVLRAFAELLVAQTRAMNLAARYEDDSFIVALTDADRRAAFIHASRIARAAEAHPLIGPAGIHASAGIASYAPRMKSFEDMIEAAAKDLEVRRTGEGRLTI